MQSGEIAGMSFIQHIVSDVIQMLYPHTCRGCGRDMLSRDQWLCLRCLGDLPHTQFAYFPGNDIERVFNGRMPLKAAHSEFYFSKGQLLQHLVHLLKYKAQQDVGIYLGEMAGQTLLKSGRFQGIDYIVPMPLYPDKEFKRGYNQAALLGEGISSAIQVPQLIGEVVRQRATETQTRKHRTERWENVRDGFRVLHPQKLHGKHILLVDDVITTGASMEACGSIILECPGTSLSVASLAHADK